MERAAGLCAAHYEQRRRGIPFRPVRDRPAFVMVGARCPPELAERLEREAKRRRITASELLRQILASALPK